MRQQIVGRAWPAQHLAARGGKSPRQGEKMATRTSRPPTPREQRHEHLRNASRPQCGQLCGPVTGQLRRAQRRGVRRSAGRGSRCAALHLGPDARAFGAAGGGAACARRGAWEHRQRDAAQHARDGRGALRGAGAERGAEHAEHAAGRTAAGLADESLRGRGADHRPRVLRR